MEPLTTATAFASIVGLLHIFKSERKADEQATIDEYLAWLRKHQHEQIANLIQDNTELTSSLNDLMANNHAEVMAKLRSLDRVLTDVAGHLTDFKHITDAMNVKSRLSDQAISILSQMNELNATKIIEFPSFDGTSYEPLDAKGTINVEEPRFINDDLIKLCEHSLLRLGFNGSEDRIFTITRAGAAVGS